MKEDSVLCLSWIRVRLWKQMEQNKYRGDEKSFRTPANLSGILKLKIDDEQKSYSIDCPSKIVFSIRVELQYNWICIWESSFYKWWAKRFEAYLKIIQTDFAKKIIAKFKGKESILCGWSAARKTKVTQNFWTRSRYGS